MADSELNRFETLRLSIDGSWTPGEFGEFFSAVHILGVSIEDPRQLLRTDSRWQYRHFDFLQIELSRMGRALDNYAPAFIDDPSVPIEAFGVDFTPRRLESIVRHASLLLMVAREEFSMARDSDPSPLNRMRSNLSVTRCTFASPGVTDIGGVAQAVGHLKDMILAGIDFFAKRQERTLTNAQRKADVTKAILVNAREYLSIRQEFGLDSEDLDIVIGRVSGASSVLGSAIVDRRLTGALRIGPAEDNIELTDPRRQ